MLPEYGFLPFPPPLSSSGLNLPSSNLGSPSFSGLLPSIYGLLLETSLSLSCKSSKHRKFVFILGFFNGKPSGFYTSIR